jgi:hypothetical protein
MMRRSHNINSNKEIIINRSSTNARSSSSSRNRPSANTINHLNPREDRRSVNIAEHEAGPSQLSTYEDNHITETHYCNKTRTIDQADLIKNFQIENGKTRQLLLFTSTKVSKGTPGEYHQFPDHSAHYPGTAPNYTASQEPTSAASPLNRDHEGLNPRSYSGAQVTNVTLKNGKTRKSIIFK